MTTKKTTRILAAMAAALLLILGVRIDTAAADRSLPVRPWQSRPFTARSGLLDREAVLKIVLEMVGLTGQQLTGLQLELDRDDGITEYEVEFRSGGVEYEAQLDAATGDLLELEREPEKTEPGPCSTAADTGISREEALAAVLTRAGLTREQVRDPEVELDRERGQLVYQVEFQSGRIEYEGEVDPATGELLRYETERDD